MTEIMALETKRESIRALLVHAAELIGGDGVGFIPGT